MLRRHLPSPPIQMGAADDTPVSIYVHNKSTMLVIMLRPIIDEASIGLSIIIIEAFFH